MHQRNTQVSHQKWYDSAHARLCVLGRYLQQIGYFDPVEKRVHLFAQRLGLPHIRGAGSFVVATLLDILGTGLFLPFSLLYFHLVIGLPLSTVGLALSLATIITVPMVPFSGILVDRFGAKWVVVASQFLQGAGIFGYLIVNGAAMLVGMALLVAAGQSLFWSAHFTLVAQIATPNERDRWYGLAAATGCGGVGVHCLPSPSSFPRDCCCLCSLLRHVSMHWRS